MSGELQGQGKARWKVCSLCKKDIPYGAEYYLCSVSTCKNKNLGLVFCSYSCWDGHKGMARHRSAWAEEETAPAA